MAKNRRARIQDQLGRGASFYQTPSYTPPANTPPPWNAGYETSVGRLGRDRDEALGEATYQEQRAKQAYGFDDASNPFSRARLLERSYRQNVNRSTNSYARGGQLYSGSLNRAQAQNRFANEQQTDVAQREYQDILRNIAQARLKATRGYEEGVVDAQAKALEDALSERPDPSEAPPDDYSYLDRNKKNKNKKRKRR